MGIKYSEEELVALISDVETQFASDLAKAEAEQADLAKSETEIVKVEPIVETDVIAKAEEIVADYDEEDMAEMNKLYSSMTKSEAELHYNAVKKAVFGDKIEKSEQPVVTIPAEVKVIEKADITKSEEFIAIKKEADAAKAEANELKKSLEQLVTSLTKSVKAAPARKAVTQLSEIEYIKKSESETVTVPTVDVSKLSKTEISKMFVSQIKSGKLTKSERDQINDYCTGDIKFDKVAHLLTK